MISLDKNNPILKFSFNDFQDAKFSRILDFTSKNFPDPLIWGDSGIHVYVVVNFLFQLVFIFPLFWGMVMYANEFKTKEKQKLTEIKN